MNDFSFQRLSKKGVFCCGKLSIFVTNMIAENTIREKFQRSEDNPFFENVIESKDRYVAKNMTNP